MCATKIKAAAFDQRMDNTTQKSLSNTFQMGPFINRSTTLKIFDIGPVQKHSTQLENGMPIILKQVTIQNFIVAASISGAESTPSGPIRTTNSSRRFKTVVILNTSSIITRETVNTAEQDALANLKRNINPRDDLRKRTRANSSLASLVVIPEEQTSTEPDYAQLCTPITNLGELPAIDLSTCSLNTQPIFNSFGSYNVPADNSSDNNDVCNNSHLNAASSSLNSSQSDFQSGNGNNTSLGGGYDSTTQIFPKFCVNNLPRDSSDHCPMHIGFNYEDTCMPRPFHFMAMWIEDPTCRDIITNSWSVNVVGSPTYKLRAKILSTKKGLRDWNKSSFGNIQTDISTIRKELLDLHISDPSDSTTSARLKARLEYLYNIEELYWKDKSREVWLLEGDRNTSYFHRVTLFKRKRNAISWIKDSSNTILTDRDSIGNSFIDYLKNLYSSQPRQFQDEILNDLPVKISAADNDTLNLPLTAEEIKNDIFQITGHIAKAFNHTNIALIPKVPLADLVSQYRPIGLCNFIYKILSKTLANRLKPFMNNIISQNQSAFIPNRSISDNILLENEAIYSVNHNDKVEGTAVIKLDMSKAYDKLEWSFLEKVLRKMGLAENWIKLINQCVSTVSYSVLLKGSPTVFFQPEKGLRKLLCYKNYLQKYCLASGQEINFDKSDILFSRRIPEHRKALLANILEIQSRDLREKYLGTPTMGAFLIPKHLCRQMDAHLCKFWWGETLEPKDRKLHLLGWDILCSPKSEGGLGFRKVEIHNLAMLARDVWKIIENPDCMLAKILKTRYFPRIDFLNAKCPDKCSWTWKCLHAIKELIKPFISWIVGDGKFIDPWCKDPHENIMHTLVLCPFAYKVWAKVMLLIRKNANVATLTTHIALSHKWMPHLFGWIICNTDGAFDDITGENGAGYVMRDFSSKASFCAAMVFEVSSAEEAEARAIWGVLKKAVEQKMTHIIIESDAKKLVEQLSFGYFDGDPRTDAIFKDIKLFSSKLSACIFSFQPRICNFVAHELAQWAKRKKSTMYWYVLPSWLAPTVEGDY
ncbi:uncharacterized protein LOC113306079 [Papaver somniferum]|uniref:uncharacterized protein LOC113306079 n=1 Tax=Papaver somniferum TaxID=3469 RepID=UPI000E6FA97D|nr:uncharacterized protein LOC113306079 [Papaver somniferum]